MELIVNQQIYYSNKERVPLKEVAESLIALDGIFKQSIPVLEGLFPGTTIESVEVFFNELKSDSIYEDIFVKFIFGTQEKLEQFIETARKNLKIEELSRNPKLLSAIVICLTLSAAYYILEKDNSTKPEDKIVINGNNNTIIQLYANEFQKEPSEFKSLIDEAIKDKENLAKNAIKMVKLAKLDPDSIIKFNNTDDLEISNASVRAMPNYVQESEEEEILEDRKCVTLEIRAKDLDNKKRGWYVVAPEIHEKRIKLQLDPTIKPEELFNRKKFKANVSILFSLDRDAEKIPKIIFLREINAVKSKKSKNLITTPKPRG